MIRREQWQTDAEPVTGPPRRSTTTTTVLHYEGGYRTTDVDDGAAWCRLTQHMYLTQRGYSLGYNFAVISGGPQNGWAYEIRGESINNAANNGADRPAFPYNANDYTRAIIVLGVQADAMTPEALATVQALAIGPVVGHRDVDGTACPGDPYYAQLPTINADPTPPKDYSMMFVWTHSDSNKPGAFLVAPGGVVHLDADARDMYLAAGAGRIDSDNTDVYESYRRVAMGIAD